MLKKVIVGTKVFLVAAGVVSFAVGIYNGKGAWNSLIDVMEDFDI